MKAPTEVLSKPLEFKVKLAIGEDAYASLKTGRNLQKMVDALSVASTGTAIAKTGTVAAMIGTKVGPLAFIGIGSMATPLPYVALAAVGSTAIYFGIMRKVRKFSNDRVITVPRFINTPLDLLAVSLFDLIAPILLKMCHVDGSVSDAELEIIEEYFVEEWGYNRDYFKHCITLLSDQIEGQQIEDLLTPLLDYIKKNPDCNQVEIANDIISILKEVAEIDGQMHPKEEAFLETVSKILCGERASLSQIVGRLKTGMNAIGNISIQTSGKKNINQ